MINKIKRFYKKDKGSFFKRLYNRIHGIVFQNIWVRKFLGVFRKETSPNHWILILSNYNSGSTLLRNILSAAKEVAYLPDESVLYTDQIKRPDEEFGWQRNWVFCQNELIVDENDDLRFEKYLKDLAPVWIKNSSSKFYLEKSISNILRIRWFEKQCKSVKFIAIVRDPIAACEGMARKSKPVDSAKSEYGKDHYEWEDLAKQYKIANEEILNMKNKVEHFKLIKYEDLCANTFNVLNEVFEYLELDKNQLIIKKNVVSINGFQFEIKNFNDKSYQNLRKTDIEKIRKINEPLLVQLGYEEIK